MDPLGGRGPLMRVFFGKNVCENERIESCRGGVHLAHPLDLPMHLGLYNKFILVTRKQVLELYVTTIERKTLYSVRVPHTAFPSAIRIQQLQLNTTTKEYNTPTTRSMLPT